MQFKDRMETKARTTVRTETKMQFRLENGVYAVFDEQVLPYLKEKDQEVLQIASCANYTSRCLKELSPVIKDCWSRIPGADLRRSWLMLISFP